MYVYSNVVLFYPFQRGCGYASYPSRMHATSDQDLLSAYVLMRFAFVPHSIVLQTLAVYFCILLKRISGHFVGWFRFEGQTDRKK